MAHISVNLKDAGLTHRGKSDGCEGVHDIDTEAVVSMEQSGYVPADRLPAILQALHELAHPEGPAFWENCRAPACADALDLLDG